MDYLSKNIYEIHEALVNKKVTPLDLVKEALEKIKNYEEKDTNKANGFSLDAGVNADYILFRDLHASSPSYEYYLRLRPNVSYTNIGGETIWSANISISLGFNVLFPEGMSPWRMF